MIRRLFVPICTLLCLASGAAAEPAAEPDPWRLCAKLTQAAERALELPPHLLDAISKVESGRWSKREEAIVAWPWTVMAEGRGRYLPSKAAAMAEVEALQAKGVRNIDVGCMQVNLMHHGHKFEDLAAALDPVQNMAYAATFLADLRRDLRSWTRAIGRYHSATPKYSGRYRLKVFRAWRAEKREANRQRRLARAAAKRRAATFVPDGL